MNRIEIKGDQWCFGVPFFIQAALFEHTGYADWEINLTKGPRFNNTDGQVDYIVECSRVIMIDDHKKYYDTINIRVGGNIYSFQSIFNSALEAIMEEMQRVGRKHDA